MPWIGPAARLQRTDNALTRLADRGMRLTLGVRLQLARAHPDGTNIAIPISIASTNTSCPPATDPSTGVVAADFNDSTYLNDFKAVAALGRRQTA